MAATMKYNLLEKKNKKNIVYIIKNLKKNQQVIEFEKFIIKYFIYTNISVILFSNNIDRRIIINLTNSTDIRFNQIYQQKDNIEDLDINFLLSLCVHIDNYVNTANTTDHLKNNLLLCLKKLKQIALDNVGLDDIFDETLELKQDLINSLNTIKNNLSNVDYIKDCGLQTLNDILHKRQNTPQDEVNIKNFVNKFKQIFNKLKLQALVQDNDNFKELFVLLIDFYTKLISNTNKNILSNLFQRTFDIDLINYQISGKFDNSINFYKIKNTFMSLDFLKNVDLKQDTFLYPILSCLKNKTTKTTKILISPYELSRLIMDISDSLINYDGIDTILNNLYFLAKQNLLLVDSNIENKFEFLQKLYNNQQKHYAKLGLNFNSLSSFIKSVSNRNMYFIYFLGEKNKVTICDTEQLFFMVQEQDMLSTSFELLAKKISNKLCKQYIDLEYVKFISKSLVLNQYIRSCYKSNVITSKLNTVYLQYKIYDKIFNILIPNELINIFLKILIKANIVNQDIYNSFYCKDILFKENDLENYLLTNITNSLNNI